MPVSLYIKLREKLFLRDPEQSDLGRNIIGHSIRMIDQLGFEEFTFKKLAKEIGSTEASIYRYFENKHQLLVYLISWYYAWIEYQIIFQTKNLSNPQKKLKIVINIIAESGKEDPNIEHIDENLLHNIVVAESAKTYLTKQVDQENKEGYFANYKSLSARIAEIITEAAPKYKFAHSLATTLIETAHEQIFFSQHLPPLTDCKIKNDDYSAIASFLEHLIFSCIKK
jgi:AcrR family transcriptional regulator